MSVSKSVAVCYRSLQAIHDLRVVAGHASERTLARLAAGLDGRASASDLRRLTGEVGCRLAPGLAAIAYPALLLAATLPNDDFEAFRASTAILIADRLQHGAGEDDLFWHWDAFQAHYRTLPDRDRAAILQGFMRLQADGRIMLHDPPSGDWIATETRSSVRRAIRPILDTPNHELAGLVARLVSQALDDPLAAPACAAAWEDHAVDICRLDPDVRTSLVRGIRHVYETRPSWQPFNGTGFDPSAKMPTMIPALSA